MLGLYETIGGIVLFIILAALYIAHEWGKSSQMTEDAEDDLAALACMNKEAQDAEKIRHKAAADTLAGRVSKYYRD